MRRVLYTGIGIVSLTLGIIGIFVPGLPTTPFLLLTSWLFYKSSKRLHDRLHRSVYLGKYIRRYESKQGVSLLSKWLSVICMWTMVCISAFGFFENGTMRWVLLGMGLIGTGSIFLFVPTAKR